MGHTPIHYGYTSQVQTNRSENGAFLGRVERNRFFKSEVKASNIPPNFMRRFIVPFLERAIEHPFVFAWRPDTYADEVALCWATGDADVSNQLANGYTQFSLAVEAGQ